MDLIINELLHHILKLSICLICLANMILMLCTWWAVRGIAMQVHAWGGHAMPGAVLAAGYLLQKRHQLPRWLCLFLYPTPCKRGCLGLLPDLSVTPPWAAFASNNPFGQHLWIVLSKGSWGLMKMGSLWHREGDERWLSRARWCRIWALQPRNRSPTSGQAEGEGTDWAACCIIFNFCINKKQTPRKRRGLDSTSNGIWTVSGVRLRMARA